MTQKPHDPRAIANLMLDEADRLGVELSNLALQKLLYFAHGLFLMQTKMPLVSGYFEAWQYGPVHPAVYRAFKEAGAGQIETRAKGQDILTGKPKEIPTPKDPAVLGLVQRVLNSYGRMSPGRLVDLSHAKDAPWAHIVDKSRTDVAFGLRIPDTVILNRFQHHKMSIGLEPISGEPSDDTPLA